MPIWDRSPDKRNLRLLQYASHDLILLRTQWEDAKEELDANHQAMLKIGHWGVPLMAHNGEPFYGQDRFDQLIWRLGIELS